MTFEVFADAAAPAISSILADASAGGIESNAGQTIAGYAAYGSSIAAAVQPLIDSFDVSVFDDGTSLRAPLGSPVVTLGEDELGNSSDGQKVAKIEREQQPITDVPSALSVTYYDPDRDYQTGEARAVADDQATNETRQDLPAALSASDGKTLAQQMLARSWAARDRLTLRLPPSRMSLEPGCIVNPGLTPASWIVDKSTIDGFTCLVELRPSWLPTASLSADPGRIVPNSDVVASPATLALIDAPCPASAEPGGPVVLIAASCPSPGWRTRTITVNGSGQAFATETAPWKSTLGHALTSLATGDPYLIDKVNSVDVELIDPEQWLTSCDDDALAGGANLAVIGAELVQFGEVTPLGQGRFRLSRLLRGRGGTEWASGTHAADELFCQLDPTSLRALAIPVWMRGTTLSAADADGTSTSLLFKGTSALPLSPADLSGAIDSAGDLVLGWIRRSRSGFAWVDEIDAPIGETVEQYRVTVATGAASLDLAAAQPSIVIPASALGPLGSGSATVEVRQIGDWGASPAAQINIDLP